MKNIVTYIIEASKITLSNRKLFIAFIILWGAFFALMFSIPLYTIPGNDLRLQMSIFKQRDYALLGILSFLSSLIMIIQCNIFRNKFNSTRNMGNAALGGLVIFSEDFSSIFATVTCAMCLGALFSFLGFGTVFFMIENRWYILIGAILLLLLSLYFASRRLVEGCRSCMVTYPIAK
jgi:hypothetical protein